MDGIQTAREFVLKTNTEKPIITFCEALDNVLGGGVYIGQIVSTKRTCVCVFGVLTYILSLSSSLPEIYIYDQSDKHSLMYTYITRTYTHMHAHVHTHPHILTHVHTYTHIHIYTYTHTNTNMYTRTHSPVLTRTCS